jgi:hypothetical protein
MSVSILCDKVCCMIRTYEREKESESKRRARIGDVTKEIRATVRTIARIAKSRK